MADGTGTYTCSASCCGGGTCPCCTTPPTFYVWSFAFGAPANAGACTKCHTATGNPATEEGWARGAVHFLSNTGTCTWASTPEKAAGLTVNCGSDLWIATQMVVTCGGGNITHTLTLYVASGASWPGFGSATAVASYDYTTSGSNCAIDGGSPVTMNAVGGSSGCTYPGSISMFSI